MVFPALKRSPRDRVPATDWLLAVVGALAAAYISIFYRDLSQRPGLPTTMDLVSAGIGMVLLLEATRRALGPALTLTALVFHRSEEGRVGAECVCTGRYRCSP